MDLRKIFVFFLFLLAVGLSAQEIKTIIVKGGPSAYKIEGRYRILHFRANVRAEPSINGKVIAVLSLNDVIEIVDYSDVEEVINEIHGFWLKIKHGNITGYTFSANIALDSLVTKLAITDKDDEITDEVKVSLHFRKSRFSSDKIFWGWDFDRNLDNDLFFYINNKRINTNGINLIPGPLDQIEFEGGKTSVLIYLIAYAREGTRKYIYKFRNNGIIEFIGEYGEWYPDWYIGD
ncbi:MAG: SH3 domain-containing protein [Treponema sp.]|jgi:hypothetical protein|nr:SH3 domain-containing protein [Treponema sp.]